MKLLIASDLHGSMTFCERLLDRFSKEKADKLVFLGDVLYHGPRNDLPEGYAPKLVAAALNSISEKLVCVRGNCDSEVDQMVLDFPVLAEYALLELDGVNVWITHGHNKVKISDEEKLLLSMQLFRCCLLKSGVTNDGSLYILTRLFASVPFDSDKRIKLNGKNLRISNGDNSSFLNFNFGSDKFKEAFVTYKQLHDDFWKDGKGGTAP